MKPFNYLRFSIVLLPLLFFWVGINFELAKFGNDPNYVYLLNALAICDGKQVGYFDHPGTTVIQLGSVAIAIQHLISNPDNLSLTDHVLTDSHTFVVSIRNLLLIFNTLGLFLLGWLAYRKTKSIWIALLLQAATFITTNTLDHAWTKISPEPFLFFITCIYAIAILYYYFEEDLNNWKYVLFFALLGGAGLATKATFLPVILFPFIVFPSLKKKFIYLAAVLPSFVLFTIPIIPEYKNMYFWIRRLISHKGIYGHGEKGFIDFNTYFPNIIRIIENNFIFALILIVGFVAVVPALFNYLKKRKNLSRENLFLTALVSVSLLGMLMVAKHYHANHYLIPVLQLTGISLFFIVRTALKHLKKESISKIIWPVIALGLILFLAWKQPPVIRFIEEGYRLTNEEMEATNAMLAMEYPDYERIYYYPNSLNPYSALNFGDVYCKRQYLPQIKETFGNVFFYDSFAKNIQNWNVEIQTEELVNRYEEKLLLTGAILGEQEAAEISKNGFPLKNIYKGRIQAIYMLDTIWYNHYNNEQNYQLSNIVYSDMELVSHDQQFILGVNGEKIEKTNLHTREDSRSGNYALKLNESIEYAMEYQLTNLEPGAEYKVEIWRKSLTPNSARLVVSSYNSSLFYKIQAEPVHTDENEWQLLRISFEVTSELENENLKVYLWNKDRQPGYFDDFSVKKISALN